MNNLISTDEPKHKLANLREYMPGQSEDLYELGRIMADYLTNDKIVPFGFVNVCRHVLYDLEVGFNEHTQERIHCSLACNPPSVYVLLWMYIPHIAKAVFPEDFAAEVKQEIETILEKAKASSV